MFTDVLTNSNTNICITAGDDGVGACVHGASAASRKRFRVATLCALALLAALRPLRARIVAVTTLVLTAYAAFLHNLRRHVAQVANASLRKIHKHT
jgi:hypothetical protein